MLNLILYIYGVLVFFYSLSLICIYVVLILNSKKEQENHAKWNKDYIRKVVDESPYTKGVSIVAGAFNEENTIVDNINSLLKQEYPLFEVVIANDGSTDKTLEKMVEAFELELVPKYDYEYKVYCRPFKGLYKSTNPKYHQLTVVDKENGKSKADAINGCLNVIQYEYFINTDADCILSKDAIYQCMFPVLLDDSVIAVSGVMSMSNGFTLNTNGDIIKYRPSNNIFALFQDLEYKRSFLIGKLGFSRLGCVQNVSGGYGFFSTDKIIKAGGYWGDSLAEDIDMLWREIGYCCDWGLDYKVVQIPAQCCFTECPDTFRLLQRQRIRWGRGLLQHIIKHRKMAFNKKYRKLGLLTFPYEIVFEFLAPIIETVGFLTMLFLIFTGGINWDTFWIMFLAIYLFSFILNCVVILYDYIQGGSYDNSTSYLKLLLVSFIEPFIYHPLITFFSLRGYVKQLFSDDIEWKSMEHKGLKKTNNG